MYPQVWLVALALLLAWAPPVRADASPNAKRWSVGSSAWMLANAFPDPAHFYYLEVSRAFNEHNALVLKPMTWTYHAPIGIPYGSSLGDASEEYPGFVPSVGLGV